MERLAKTNDIIYTQTTFAKQHYPSPDTMNITSHLKLYQRNWIAILFVGIIIASAVAYTLIGRDTTTHQATIFASIATRDDVNSSSLDDFQAADQFTESIQGWFKNPSLLKDIASRAHVDSVSLAARKQEKQNLIITFEAENEREAEDVAGETIAVLQEELAKYNVETGQNFTLALSSADIGPTPDQTMLFIVIALILGLAGGIGLAYLYEFLFGIISFPHQVEQIYQKKADEIRSRKGKKSKDHYLEALLTDAKHKKNLFIHVNHHGTKKNDTEEHIQFPQDVKTVKKSTTQNIIVIVRPGKSKAEHLQQLKPLLPEEYWLVIEY